MSLPIAHAPFWTTPLDQGQRVIIYYFLVVAALALLAQFLRTLTSVNEIGTKYRGAMFASLGVLGAAFLSYVVLTLKFDVGYRQSGGTAGGVGAMWLPTQDAIWSWAPRFMDWSVTVPLLMVQMVVVSTLVGRPVTRYRAIGVVCAWLMIFTGFLGGIVIDDGRSLTALWTWGVISGVFMVILYVLIIAMMVKAKRLMTSGSARTYLQAGVLLMVTWFVYPIVFGFQGYTKAEGGWTVMAQVALTVADVIAKVGFGALIHKLAKQRTAEDVAEGRDTSVESQYISGTKMTDAVLPPMQHDHDHEPEHAVHAVGVEAVEQRSA